MSTGAIISAAGHRSQTAKFEPMLPIGDTTVIKRIILTLKQASIDPIVVITGDQGEELEKHISKMRVICLRNEKFEDTKMFDSICLGLNYIQNLCDQVLIMPTKIPLLLSESIHKLLESKAPIACPVFNGRRGHPVLISKQYIPDIVSYKGSGGFKELLRQADFKPLVEEVPVEDEGIILSIGSDADYEDVLEKAKSMQMPIYTSIHLFLGKEEIFFGPGIAQFLTLVDHTGSMQTACKQMHMSYSKGWKIIKTAEKQLGYSLLITQTGGREGGFSYLTDKAKDFLNRFLQMEQELTKEAEKLYEKYFQGGNEIL